MHPSPSSLCSPPFPGLQASRHAMMQPARCVVVHGTFRPSPLTGNGPPHSWPAWHRPHDWHQLTRGQAGRGASRPKSQSHQPQDAYGRSSRSATACRAALGGHRGHHHKVRLRVAASAGSWRARVSVFTGSCSVLRVGRPRCCVLAAGRVARALHRLLHPYDKANQVEVFHQGTHSGRYGSQL